MDEEKQKILSQEERDAFTGTTIDENGNAHNYNDSQRDVFRDRAEQQNNSGSFRHYSIHTSNGCGIYAFAAIIIFALIFGMFIAVLPYYLVGVIVVGILGWIANMFR